MQTDAAQWFANTIAGWALGVGAVSLVTAIVAVVFSRSQAQSAKRHAKAAEDTLRLQAEALQSQADDWNPATGLRIMRENLLGNGGLKALHSVRLRDFEFSTLPFLFW